MQNQKALDFIGDFFGVPVEELAQFYCSYCEGSGDRYVQMGGKRLCDKCAGSGFSPMAFANRAKFLLDSAEFNGLAPEPPADSGALLADVLGSKYYDALRAVADKELRTPLHQVMWWIKDEAEWIA